MRHAARSLIAAAAAAGAAAAAPGDGDGDADAQFAAAWMDNYCNAVEDWGPVDQKGRDFEPARVVILVRHGARIVSAGAQNIKGIGCWPGDAVEYDCGGASKNMNNNLYGPNNGIAFYSEFDNKKDWRGTCHAGQLLNSGIRQHEANGRRLVEAYRDTAILKDVAASVAPGDTKKALDDVLH